MSTALARLAAVLSVLTAGLALYCFLTIDRSTLPLEEPASLVVADRDLGFVPIGKNRVELTITNQGTQRRRIVASHGTCLLAVCISAVQEGEVWIGPGEVLAYPCEVTVREPGPFQIPLTLFLDDNGLRTVTLTVRGVGIPPEDPPAKSKVSVP